MEIIAAYSNNYTKYIIMDFRCCSEWCLHSAHGYYVKDTSPASDDCVAFISPVLIRDFEVSALLMVTDDRPIAARMSVRTRTFFLLRNVETQSQRQPSSCSVATDGSFSGCKAVGQWYRPHTSIYLQCRGEEWVELYLYAPNISSWYSA
jgi:hypothetical protein